MAKKKDKTLYVGALVLGIFLLITYMNIQSQVPEIVFDGQQNEFKIELLKWDNQVEVGDTSSMELKVTNEGELAGSMYVQCSILNKEDHSFLNLVQSVTYIPQESNCVAGEPYTQTGIVTLEPNDHEIVTFTMVVPDSVGKTNTVFCQAYEQCYEDDQNTLESGAVIKEIEIILNDGIESNNNYMRSAEVCELTSDCFDNFFGFKVKCLNGLCVDVEDAAEVETQSPESTETFKVDLTDTALSTWAKEHKILLSMMSIILIVIGMIGTFIEPKKPREPQTRLF